MCAWHRSGIEFPFTALDGLVSCCMLEVSTDDRMLPMHDQLRDLAYSIVRGERSIAQRTRLRGRDAEDAIRERVRAQLLQSCYKAWCLKIF